MKNQGDENVLKVQRRIYTWSYFEELFKGFKIKKVFVHYIKNFDQNLAISSWLLRPSSSFHWFESSKIQNLLNSHS